MLAAASLTPCIGMHQTVFDQAVAAPNGRVVVLCHMFLLGSEVVSTSKISRHIISMNTLEAPAPVLERIFQRDAPPQSFLLRTVQPVPHGPFLNHVLFNVSRVWSQ